MDDVFGETIVAKVSDGRCIWRDYCGGSELWTMYLERLLWQKGIFIINDCLICTS